MTFLSFALRNVVRNKRTYAAYFISSAFSVMIFFVCALFTSHPAIKGGLLADSAVNAMVGAEWILYAFAFLFVLYSVSSFLNSRSREFGIYRMHGMTTRQLGHLVFWENMLIGIAAIGLGIIAGLLTGKLFLMVCSAFLDIPSLPFQVTWSPLLWTIGSFAALFVAISLITSAMLGSSRLVDLFQAGQRPKANQKPSTVLALLAIILLAASYALAATSAATTVYYRVIPVVAMTIVGTYLLYAQLIGLAVQRLKRYRPLSWRRTNVVTIASLAHRFKDNARMFFMVTILSTVSFCSVGVFASTHTLLRSFLEDYPAAIAYVAKQGSQVGENHVEQLKAELASKGIDYQIAEMPIHYVEVRAANTPKRLRTLPIIRFSDYKTAVELAGHAFDEKQLQGGEGLVILTTQRERSYISARKMDSYLLMDQPDITIHETGYTTHVPIPNYLSAKLDIELEAEFGGIVVSDDLFERIVPDSVDRYTGFYVPDYKETAGIGAQLAKDGLVRYQSGAPYAITVSGTLYEVQRSLYSMMLLVSLLIGAMFFIAAGSFLYFRLYSDLDYDRRQYAMIAKLGLTDKELSAIVTRQLAILFFVPTGVAVVHSLFAFAALQTMFYLSIAAELGIVLASFIAAQLAYFYFIRQRYLRNLRKRMS
ncbi:FtsX-like permease family protein [Paenibacillus radicis (ex Gao et al. 2016)]|uniref:ABC transporter permease n=1 Tax=Paenibacillus radicis (ex Gao et al. 2016) TaxID=1737354 RepID=A0A917M2L3_9BACL|nr:ABC transporter permease [Paenibacillus radicis (ex Gao et al. 2016)]GGG71058.1 ABC transporter permease [Paenibacillus radicis (ex Gao et al. 2016)]